MNLADENHSAMAVFEKAADRHAGRLVARLWARYQGRPLAEITKNVMGERFATALARGELSTASARRYIEQALSWQQSLARSSSRLHDFNYQLSLQCLLDASKKRAG